MVLFAPEIIEALGWTIVHSLWQATVLAIVLALLMLLFRNKSAQIKYFISFAALLGMLAWVSVTFVNSYQYAAEKQIIKEQITSNPGYIKALIASPQTELSGVESVQHNTINFEQVRLRAFFQRNFQSICLIWLLGMAILMVRLVTGFIYARRLRTYQLVPLPETWSLKVNEMMQSLGIKRKVKAFFSPLAKVPLTLGTIKPVILFPVTAFTGLSVREIEAIIAHELAHVMRNDYLFNIIQSMVEILFFYHPAVWVISSQIRAERENCCDNIAIETTGDKLNYIKALAAVQKQQFNNAQLSMAFSAKKGSVLNRIKRLQNEIAMKTNFLEGLIAAGVIVAGLTLASFTSANPKNEQTATIPQQTTSIEVDDTLPAIDRDSLRVVLEERIQQTHHDAIAAEELQKAVEIAYSESNEALSSEMMAEIDLALKEINISKIIQEAMREASIAMKEASVEIEQARKEVQDEQINRQMKEAAREIEQARKEMEYEMRRDMSAEGIDKATIEAAISAASAGMDIAAKVVGSLDIEGIVTSALDGVSAAFNAFGNIEFDSLPEDPANEASTDQKERIKKLEKEKKQLEKEQAQLEKRLKELEKKLDK